MSSKWKCPSCGSGEVEIALPVWFKESHDHELTQTSIDAEAEPLHWTCNECGECDSGAPDRAEAEPEEAEAQQYSVVLEYSTFGTSPREALLTALAAIDAKSGAFVTVYDASGEAAAGSETVLEGEIEEVLK